MSTRLARMTASRVAQPTFGAAQISDRLGSSPCENPLRHRHDVIFDLMRPRSSNQDPLAGALYSKYFTFGCSDWVSTQAGFESRHPRQIRPRTMLDRSFFTPATGRVGSPTLKG